MVPPAYTQQPPMQYQYPGQQPGRSVPPQWPPQTAQQPSPSPSPSPPITARGMMQDPPKMVNPPLISAPKLTPVSMPSPEEIGVVPVKVALPSAEELGVVPPGKTATTKIDWNETRNRLARLGAIGWQSMQLNDGRHRVAFVLRTKQVDQVQHIEATAATEAEAVTAALARAEEWAAK
jgi:hypothetical protein